MAKLLVIYPTPIDALCQLQHDAGWSVDGKPYTDTNGRPGQSFDIKDDTPNYWGCRLVLSHAGKVSIMMRGLLVSTTGNWLFYADDFTMQDVPPPVIIELPPVPPTNPPSTALTPYQIIQAVYATGKFNLATKEGCGMFVEECTKQLHERHSPNWGHIKKIPPQNNYNGHAVDAMQLLQSVLTSNGNTEQGIYDIITSSESVDAKPAFNRTGDCRPDLWYYNG
jgi:hypothetical protein